MFVLSLAAVCVVCVLCVCVWGGSCILACMSMHGVHAALLGRYVTRDDCVVYHHLVGPLTLKLPHTHIALSLLQCSCTVEIESFYNCFIALWHFWEIPVHVLVCVQYIPYPLCSVHTLSTVFSAYPIHCVQYPIHCVQYIPCPLCSVHTLSTVFSTLSTVFSTYPVHCVQCRIAY